VDSAPAVQAWLKRLPALTPGRVAACVASLHHCAVPEQQLASVLSAEEQSRAEMFRFANDRQRFVISHALLRTVVAHQLGMSARKIPLSANAFERPCLVGIVSPNCISLSHAGALLAVAVARTGEVGIDVEPWERDGSLAEVVQLALSGNEARALQQLPADRRLPAFLRCWCSKEAITKALGTGLSEPLPDIDIGIGGDGKVDCQRFRHVATGLWFDLHHLELAEGCGCIASGPSAVNFDVVTGEVDDFLR
jgi:4'-phosphopantetheinyl transferase